MSDNTPSVEYRADHPSGLPWLAFDGTVGTSTGKRFCVGVYATEAEAWAALGMAPDGLPVVVDRVAYDAEGVNGLAWDCPACGVGGTNPGGEDEHNRYAHRADVLLADGVYWLRWEHYWDMPHGSSALIVDAAMRHPGLVFGWQCDCNRFDGWNDETQIHQYGCGETFVSGTRDDADAAHRAIGRPIVDVREVI